MSASENEVIREALTWAASDPDPTTRAELERLVEQRDLSEVSQRMLVLEFGTAGLRGLVGAGSGRMNRAVILRTTRGLAEYLLRRIPDARILPVVVGYDARLTSREFAQDAVAALAGAGLNVRVFPGPVPTPLVAYAAKQLGACAAVVITASHNPAEYNGYKVYGLNAAQITAPVDLEIARHIAAVPQANAIPLSRGDSERVKLVDEGMFDRYLAELTLWRPPPILAPDLRILYTPLHGVGWNFARKALVQAGHRVVEAVSEQAEPDGNFPTVRFPNPEEHGTLELAIRRATELGSELILANDPDADRLAVCVPDPSGGWVQLTGDQVGILLADFLLSYVPRTRKPLVVSSIVSSPMLNAIAKHWGAHCERTLTGFKWMCNAALKLEADGVGRFIFGYEEALGYAIPMVRDKDGISAAVLFADLAVRARADGQSIIERLDGLYRRFGLWVSSATSLVSNSVQGVSAMAESLNRLRQAPPTEICGHRVNRATDYAVGASERSPWLGHANLLELELDGGSRVLIRPSGTEPKLKVYLHWCCSLGADANIREHQCEAQAEAKSVALRVAELLDLG